MNKSKFTSLYRNQHYELLKPKFLTGKYCIVQHDQFKQWITADNDKSAIHQFKAVYDEHKTKNT